MRGKPKALVLDAFNGDFFDELRKYCEVAEILDDTAKDTEILVVRSKTRVDMNLLRKLPNLRLVISATHGEDHIDKKALQERNVSYRNAPVQSYDVAQGVMAFVFAFATNLARSDRSLKSGRWEKKEIKGFRIRGKILGIVGYGRIGKEVARQAVANGINVIVYEKNLAMRAESKLPLTFVDSLDELLTQSDIVTLHVPLSPDTKGMIGDRELGMLKNSAYLINATRGGVVDEGALLKALDGGKLAGAAVDVFEYQPPFGHVFSEALARHEKVVATPHNIAQTDEALKQKADDVLNAIMEHVRKGP